PPPPTPPPPPPPFPPGPPPPPPPPGPRSPPPPPIHDRGSSATIVVTQLPRSSKPPRAIPAPGRPWGTPCPVGHPGPGVPRRAHLRPPGASRPGAPPADTPGDERRIPGQASTPASQASGDPVPASA